MSHRRASVYAPAPRIDVLAVDDNAVNRSLVEAVLRRSTAVESYTLLGSYGETAQSLLSSVAVYGLVLLDIDLGPGRPTGGIDIALDIRAGRYGHALRSAYVVAVTSDFSFSHVRMYRNAEMDGCVAKPFSPDTLGNLVVRLARATQACIPRAPFFLVDRNVAVSTDPLHPIISTCTESAVDDGDATRRPGEPRQAHIMRRSDAGARRRSQLLDTHVDPLAHGSAVPAHVFDHRPRAYSAGAAGQYRQPPR